MHPLQEDSKSEKGRKGENVGGGGAGRPQMHAKETFSGQPLQPHSAQCCCSSRLLGACVDYSFIMVRVRDFSAL